MRVVLVPLVIASVLFLGAAGSVTALTPAPEKGQKPANSNKRDAAPQAYASPQACPSVSVIIKEIPVPEAKQITAVIQQRPYGHWWQSQSAPEWALFFLTIPYVVVSICVFVVTWRAANAAESSAAAALVSAQAAKQAIHTDRPLVIVQDIDAGADFSNLSFTPKVVFRNYGNSPAILMEVCLGLQTITGDLWRAGVTQETVRQWQYQRNKIQKQVLGTNDPIIELITMK